MKKTVIFLTLTMLFSIVNANAQTLTHVMGSPTGFASMNGGTTGGEGGPVVTVTNQDELKAAVDGVNTPVIVLVRGTIHVSGEMSARSNKTIVGLGTDARIAGGGFAWNTRNNVIVQNITFEDAADDLLKINNRSRNIWIDHCTFSDGASTNAGNHDGMIDITRGSEFVTVSYCRFFNHDKNILIGHSNGESGDVAIKVTMNHNWFDGTVQRNPRVRFATVHLYNNFHVNNRIYGIASTCDAKVLVENSYFKDTPIPMQLGVEGHSPEGFLVHRGCFFENSGTPQSKFFDTTGLIPYTYELDDVMYVPCIVRTFSGAGMPHKTAENVTCTPENPGTGGGGGGGGGGTTPNPEEPASEWRRNNLFPGDTDANDWFWFNNQTVTEKYLGNMITLFGSESASGVISVFLASKVGAGTNGTAGSAGAHTGCLDLGRSGTKGVFTGGSAVFQLPSCGEFRLITSRTGDNLFRVQTATSAAGPFTDVFTFSSSSGIANVDISQHVQSENPIWVRIVNGATGSLNIHAVKISSYERIVASLDAPSTKPQLSFHHGMLSFSHAITAPAEIRILSLEGRTIDIPFRGWVEAGKVNRIGLKLDHLASGIYLLVMNTREGSTTLKIRK